MVGWGTRTQKNVHSRLPLLAHTHMLHFSYKLPSKPVYFVERDEERNGAKKVGLYLCYIQQAPTLLAVAFASRSSAARAASARRSPLACRVRLRVLCVESGKKVSPPALLPRALFSRRDTPSRARGERLHPALFSRRGAGSSAARAGEKVLTPL